MRYAAAAVLVAALALASCGGGDDSDSGYSPVVSEPLSKVEFLRQADAICNSSESRIEAAADDVATQRNPDPTEVERIAIDLVVPALESEIAAIGAIGPPDGDDAEVQAILDATQDGIDEIRADPRGLTDGEVPSGLRKAEKLASAYGSQQCGIR